jgi:hypothetical protein
MKRFLISISALTLLSALPFQAAGQPTPIPPETTRQTPLTETGKQDISPSFETQGRQERSGPRRTLSEREEVTAPLVLRAQEELRDLGYNPGPLDGILGPGTRQALRDYQRDYNLPVTGTLNAQTRQKLLGDERASAPESRRQPLTSIGRQMTEGEIQVAEQNLKELGFDPGPVDGVFTAETEAALRATASPPTASPALWRCAMRYLAIGLCLGTLAAGCAMGPELTPAPGAKQVAGREDTAVAEVAGVRTVVRTDAWTGVPAVLPELTPLQVSMENHSGRPCVSNTSSSPS